MCAAIHQNVPRPNVGAAQPCEAIRVYLQRKRTDNWAVVALLMAMSLPAKSRCYPLNSRREGGQKSQIEIHRAF
jgi:hypothetical protein